MPVPRSGVRVTRSGLEGPLSQWLHAGLAGAGSGAALWRSSRSGRSSKLHTAAKAA